MGKQLDDCINARIKLTLEQNTPDQNYSQGVLGEVTAALYDKWHSEIKQEILTECTEEEKQQIRYAVDKEREAYSAKKEVEDLRALIVEGILLAIIVGLLVNQTTDLIAYLKGEKAYMATVVISVILALLLFIYILTRLASVISRLMKK